MKRFVSVCALLSALLWLTPAVHAQSNLVQPGTQVRLTLVDGLTTSVAHDGDPFTAIVAEPVFSGNQLLLPAGAENPRHGDKRYSPEVVCHGARRRFHEPGVQFDRGTEPYFSGADEHTLALQRQVADDPKKRKDLKTTEGVVVEEKRDIKNDVMTAGLGTGGGALGGCPLQQRRAGYCDRTGRHLGLHHDEERQGRRASGTDWNVGAHGFVSDAACVAAAQRILLAYVRR